MRVCETCGCRSVAEREVEGVRVLACGTCGEVAGDDSHRAQIEDARVSRRLGLEAGIEPLVQALNRIEGIETSSSCEGHAASGAPPFVSFHLQGRDLCRLERISLAIEMASRKTSLRWGIEIGASGRVSYTLRPRRSWSVTHRMTPQDVEAARSDIVVLAQEIERAASSSWFNAP